MIAFSDNIRKDSVTVTTTTTSSGDTESVVTTATVGANTGPASPPMNRHERRKHEAFTRQRDKAIGRFKKIVASMSPAQQEALASALENINKRGQS